MLKAPFPSKPPFPREPQAFACRKPWWLLALVVLLFLLTLRPAVAAPAQRIVSLAPAVTEMLYALGLGDRVVGVTSYCNYPPAAKSKPSMGAANGWNEERLIAARPDLILSAEGEPGKLDRFRRLTGASLVVLRTRHVPDIWKNMRAIGRLTGSERRAEALTASLHARLTVRAAAHRGKPARTAFYMVWNQPLMTAGAGSYLNDLITLAGGRNVVASLPGGSYPSYSWEALLVADPDVILGPENLKPALADLKRRYPRLKAVKAGRVRTLPDDLISRPGPRVVEALATVEAALR